MIYVIHFTNFHSLFQVDDFHQDIAFVPTERTDHEKMITSTCEEPTLVSQYAGSSNLSMVIHQKLISRPKLILGWLSDLL